MNETAAEPVGIPPLATITREAYDQMLATGMLFEIYPAATGDHTQDLALAHPMPTQPSMALAAVIERMKIYAQWRAGSDPRDMTAAGILPGQITADTLALIEAGEDLLAAQDRLDCYWRTHPTVAGACDAVMKAIGHADRVRWAALQEIGEHLNVNGDAPQPRVYKAHRILATNTVDGVHRGPAQNLAGPAFAPALDAKGRCVNDPNGDGDCQHCCDTREGCPHRQKPAQPTGPLPGEKEHWFV